MLQTDGKLQQLKDDEAQPHNQEMTSKTSHQLLKSVVDKICDAYERYPGDAADYLKTGFSELDANHLGLAKGSLTLLAGDANSGKTLLMCNIASHLAVEQHKAVGIITFRLSGEQLMKRILASAANIEVQRLDTGMLLKEDWHNFTESIKRLSHANMRFNEACWFSVEQFIVEIERMVSEYQLDFLAIDDFPFAFCAKDRQHSMQTSALVVESLRHLARRLNIPMILTAGISANVHKRHQHRPTLADLALHGEIVSPSDSVLFLYRDQLYNPDTTHSHQTELLIAKNNNGNTGKVLLKNRLDHARFEDFHQNVDWCTKDC